MVPPIVAALLTLAVLGITGQPINLFSVLALLLVLGIGIDYTIFFAEAKEKRETAMLAILLSACTTILSFGFLSLASILYWIIRPAFGDKPQLIFLFCAICAVGTIVVAVHLHRRLRPALESRREGGSASS